MTLLNLRHQHFVSALLADPTMNQTNAYEKVFVAKGAAASANASKLMARPDIKAAIAEAVAARLDRVAMTADEVLADLTQVATTSTNELVEWRIGCCRYCHGGNFEYQRKPSEYREALEAYLVKNSASDPGGMRFPMQGGVGYDKRRSPHPDCPECFGEGEGREHIKDSRTLSKGANVLYGGVRRTKNGIEVLQRSKDRAIDLLARHTGVAKENITVKATVAAALAVAPIATADPQEAARAYQKLMEGG